MQTNASVQDRAARYSSTPITNNPIAPDSFSSDEMSELSEHSDTEFEADFASLDPASSPAPVASCGVVVPSDSDISSDSDTSSTNTHISSGMGRMSSTPSFGPLVRKRNIAEPPFGSDGYEMASDTDDNASAGAIITGNSTKRRKSEKKKIPPVGPNHGSLPGSLQRLLEEYYLMRGQAQPPPCAINKMNSYQITGRASGKPARRYVNNNNEEVTASCQPVGFGNQYVMILEGPTEPPVIVRFFAKDAQKGSRFFAWRGVEGWERVPSFWKVKVENAGAMRPAVAATAASGSRRSTRLAGPPAPAGSVSSASAAAVTANSPGQQSSRRTQRVSYVEESEEEEEEEGEEEEYDDDDEDFMDLE